MMHKLFIEDLETGRIRVHKNIQENLRHYAAYADTTVGAIETKKELMVALGAAIAGAGLSEVMEIAERSLKKKQDLE